MKKYTMNGKTYTKLTAIADELGLSRIRPSQFSKYGITEVSDQDSTPVVDTPVTPAQVDDIENTAPVTENNDTPAEAADEAADPCEGCDYPCKEDGSCPHDTQPQDNHQSEATNPPADDAAEKKDEPKAKQPKAPKTKEPTLADNITAAGKVDENISDTVSLEDFSKAIKKVSLDTLDKVAEAANIDLTDTRAASNGVAHALPDAIRRMHLTIILREHFYPGQKLEAKKASQFRKVDLAILTAKADELGLIYTKRDNDAITRMWVTKALVDAGVTYDDVVPPQDDITPADPAEDATAEAVSA